MEPNQAQQALPGRGKKRKKKRKNKYGYREEEREKKNKMLECHWSIVDMRVTSRWASLRRI